MKLTKEQEKEYALVNKFVEKQAKTWFFEPKQCWNSAITCGIDIQEFGYSAEQSKTNLTNRLFNSDFCRKNIVEWAKNCTQVHNLCTQVHKKGLKLHSGT